MTTHDRHDNYQTKTKKKFQKPLTYGQETNNTPSFTRRTQSALNTRVQRTRLAREEELQHELLPGDGVRALTERQRLI